MTRALALLVTLMASASFSDGRAQPASAVAASSPLQWQPLPDVAGPIGLKGMYGAVSHDRVLLAGGSNFPVPQRAGGRKTFHAAIYLRSVTATPDVGWALAAETLPQGRGEGASVTALGRVIGLGGDDGNGPVADVFLLRWNPNLGRVESSPLPALPVPASNPAATVLGRWLYVAGGMGRDRSLDTFWRLDLEAPAAGWETLPTWPGRPRFGGLLVPVGTSAGPQLMWAGGIEGPARSQSDYLRDAYRFEPGARRWRPAATLPRGAVLGSALAVAADRVLVLGGSDGHDFASMREQGERYRLPGDVLGYDGQTDRWSVVGEMPVGVVGAAVVAVGSRWWVAGGEYSPGLRTPRVHELQVNVP